jgi:hypothetical protein
LLLGVAVLALCGSVLLVASGMLGPAVAGFGRAVEGMFGAVTGPGATAIPTAIAVPGAPRLVVPTDGYTNRPVWDVQGYAPGDVVGKPGYTVRVYVDDALSREQPLTATQDFLVVGVPIPDGRCRITATIVGPGGESAPSAPISVVYDSKPPAIILTAPTDGQVVNAGSVTFAGRTQTGATVLVTNDTTRQSATIVATKGTFTLDVPLSAGTNHMTVTATDLAGNVATKSMSVIGGSGKPTVTLRLSNARIALADLPKPITMTVTVLDANGSPVKDAAVSFGLAVPGLPPATFDATTDADGHATWTTTIPSEGVTAGNALVTVIVTTPTGTELRQAASFRIV